MRSVSVLAATILLAAVPALADSTVTKGVEEPSAAPTLGAQIVQGCFASKGELVFKGTPEFNSKSSCAKDTCKALGLPVAGTMGGNQCYCGDKYPPKAALTNDSDCNVGCTGYDQQACGGINFWTIYNVGLTLAVESSDDSLYQPSSSSSTTKSTAVVTATASAFITVSATNDANAAKSGGSNTAGIAAGVVVGVVVVSAIIGGIFFIIRRRRNKELEEEHRRNAAINTFFDGKPPSSSGGFSVTDARLDPVMAQRRVSNGSIADNQDYSRRILRVTNA